MFFFIFLCIIVMLLSAVLDPHSDGTHSLQGFIGGQGKGKGKWCVAKYGDPYSEFVLCI